MTRNLCPTRGGHSINSRVISICHQRILSHILALPPHGIPRAIAICHNAPSWENGRRATEKLFLGRAAA